MDWVAGLIAFPISYALDYVLAHITAHNEPVMRCVMGVEVRHSAFGLNTQRALLRSPRLGHTLT